MSDPLATAAELLRTGKPAKAAALLTPLLRKAPEHAPLRYLLGAACMASGDAKTAAFHLESAAKMEPNNVAILAALAKAQEALGRGADAIGTYQRALRIDPKHHAARAALCELFLASDNTAAAEELHQRAVREQPEQIAGWMGLSDIEMVTCRTRQSVARLSAASVVNPQRPELNSYLGVALTYLPGVPCREVFEVHRDFGVKVMSMVRATPPAFTSTRDPERPLVIGWLSPDLRQHSIAFFLEPLLENLDKAAFTSVLLSTSAKRDDMTDRLSKHGRLVALHDVEPQELAARIQRENVDILIELSGHTTNNRLLALARRPAPVVVSYLGYANTTGLPGIDYRVVDAITDPPVDAPDRTGLDTFWPWDTKDEISLPWPGADELATESLVRVGTPFLCYRPPADSPEPSPPPSQAHTKPITLGTFNAMHKIQPEVVALWAKAMHDLPGSRIILKGDYRLSAARKGMLAWFAGAGISADRVEIRGTTASARDHLAQYADLDIALDTFPYNGTTTTCEALHMGVPVVSLVGRTHASRVGCSLLTAIGLRDLVCDSPETFVNTVKVLATDPARLAELRRTLRTRLASSPLCDGPAYATRFGAALRQMWRVYAAGQPASALSQASGQA